jgi:hypothetical protein
MRQWLFSKEGIEKVKLESAEVQKAYDTAGRKYRIQYFNVPAGRVSSEIQFQLETQKKSFDAAFHEFFGDETIPERKVDWNSAGHEAIHSALFSDRLEKGQIVGPLSTDEGRNMFIRIQGWSDGLAIADTDIQKRRRDVIEKLKERNAVRIYESFVGKFMNGKRIEFDPGTFKTLANLLAPLYLKPQEEKEEMFMDMVFERDKENPSAENFNQTIEQIRGQSFCRFNGRIWSVGDFLTELEKHPLVFRKRRLQPVEFAEQLKLAVVDMVRDWHLTQEAYRRGYEKVQDVKRTTDMWRDADLALDYRQKYLKTVIPAGIDSLPTLKIIGNYLNPCIDSLQKKYDQDIEVNVRAFEGIQLTRIDMFVLQRDVPFPIVVPSFPQVTTDHTLDYGRAMKGTAIRNTEETGH